MHRYRRYCLGNAFHYCCSWYVVKRPLENFQITQISHFFTFFHTYGIDGYHFSIFKWDIQILATSPIFFVGLGMMPALAFFEAGLLRKKNTVSLLTQIFVGLSVLAVQWHIIGFSLVYGPDRGSVIGDLSYVFFRGINNVCLRDFAPRIPGLAFALFQMMFAAITPLLMTGWLRWIYLSMILLFDKRQWSSHSESLTFFISFKGVLPRGWDSKLLFCLLYFFFDKTHSKFLSFIQWVTLWNDN